MNILIFKLEIDFGEDILLAANNELDLRDELEKKGFTDIKFEDIEFPYGKCYLKDLYGTEVADCYYVKKV